jgi:hypothetical protein
MHADAFKKAAISTAWGLRVTVTFQVALSRTYLLFVQEPSAFIGTHRRLLKDWGGEWVHVRIPAHPRSAAR